MISLQIARTSDVGGLVKNSFIFSLRFSSWKHGLHLIWEYVGFGSVFNRCNSSRKRLLKTASLEQYSLAEFV